MTKLGVKLCLRARKYIFIGTKDHVIICLNWVRMYQLCFPEQNQPSNKLTTEIKNNQKINSKVLFRIFKLGR